MKPTTVSFPDAHALALLYGWVPEGGLDSAIAYPALDMLNDSGVALVEGDVVVVTSDGSVAKTTTAGDERPTGVCLDDIDDGDSGPVQFVGPVDLINVTASVTAGQWGSTSTTSGAASASGSPDDAFVYFTSSGTEPEGFLWPGGGGGSGFSEAEARDLFVLRTDGGEEAVASLGNLGSTETIDLATGNWQRGTLNADCTLSFTGATNGVGCSFTLFLTEDGTGGWEPTWPGTVAWIGGTTPTHDTTAGSVTIYVFLSYDGGSSWYGFQAGGGGGSGASALDDLTDVVITAPAEDDDLRYNGSIWVNDARKWEAVTDGEDVFVWVGDDLVHEWSV